MAHPFIISYGFHPTPFGQCLLAQTDLGICHISFTDNQEQSLADLQETWPDAQLICNASKVAPIIQQIFSSSPTKKPYHVELHLKGTPFQLDVWDALINVPRGTTISYSQLAQQLGKPQATRAVASAVAQNHVAVIVPCHRVIAKDGSAHKYRWGAERKKALLAWEAQR